MTRYRLHGLWRRMIWLMLLLAATVEPAWSAPSTSIHREQITQAVVVKNASGVLWKVEQAGRKASYVFGTIHSGDARVMPPPAVVLQALNESKIFLMELIPDEAALMAISDAMFFHDEQTLARILGEEWYRQTAVLLMKEYGYPTELVNKLKPWAALMILSVPVPEPGEVLDVMMYHRAQEAGIPVRGLETAEEQVAVFAGMSLEDQLALLKETVKNHAVIMRDIDKLIDLYVAGDLRAIENLSHEYLQGTDQRLTERLLKRAVDDRNRRMVERVLPLLEKQSVFIAVGALHLPGERGVLRLLEQKGYRVTPVR